MRSLGDEVPTTASERALPPGLAIHRVRDLEGFDAHLNQAVARIQEFSDVQLRAGVQDAGAWASGPQPR